jgi:nitronate monooxygenase
VWTRTRIAETLRLEYPIIGAPMGGGPSTPALAAAISNAGGLGTLSGGYLTPAQITADIEATRALTPRPFAVNLFTFAMPPQPPRDELDAANRSLDAYRAELGLAAGTLPSRYSEDVDEQFDAMLRARPAAFSFTFGIPPVSALQACRAAGIYTIGTATNVAEGIALQEAGVDAVCAQGAEAGGHRGTFLGEREAGLIGLFALVPQLVAALDVPVIAAGGIMNGAGIAAARMLGADAVQLGTAFLRANEAGTNDAFRRALASPGVTAITSAFSGRDARGIENRFMRERASLATPPYPYQNALTRDVRQAAARAGRAEFLSLFAGEAFSLGTDGSAAEIFARLVREAETTLAHRSS